MESGIELSIIIPAYNEARRIGQTLKTLRQYTEQQMWRVEVIVVNDGSTDNTCRIVSDYATTWPHLRLLDNGKNQGKGFTVKNGARHAAGQTVLFTDADLSAPPEEMPKILDPIRANLADVTFGSRAIDRSLIGVHQSRFRETSGIIFNFFMQHLTGLHYKDTQCGFKAFRREEILPVFERQRIMGFGFDPEILYIARKQGLRLREIPVRWNHVEGTTVRFLRDSFQMFLDLLYIRWNDWRGKYN
jgi:glycosyltransferase involved in cell wall biosynthesis